MVVSLKIEDPIDIRTTADKLYGSRGQLYFPDLPETKIDRLQQYRVGNIPLSALSSWEQREATTGQDYHGYMMDVKVRGKARIAAEAEVNYEKHRQYMNSLGGPGELLYDAELKKMELQRIREMSKFEEEWGWSFEDTLAFARGEGPKYELFEQLGGEKSPSAMHYWEGKQDAVYAAEQVLWKNARAVAITSLSDIRTPEELLAGELSQYQKFAQARYDWQFQSEVGVPWKGDIQTLLLQSGVDFTGPVIRMTLDDYRIAGAFKPGDEFDWQTARLYGVDIPEGSTLRVNPAQGVTYSIVSVDEDTSILTEREINITEYEIWEVNEPRFADYEKMLQLGFTGLEGTEGDTFTVVLNENDMYQVLQRISGDWTFDVAGNDPGSAVFESPTGPVSYNSTQMAEMENQQVNALKIAERLLPDMKELLDMLAFETLFQARVESIIAWPEVGPSAPTTPQTADEFVAWAGETKNGEYVNTVAVVDMMRNYGDTPDTRQFLRYFYGLKDTREEYEVLEGEEAPLSIDDIFHEPDIIDALKKAGLTGFYYGAVGAMKGLEQVGELVDIPGKMFALPLTLAAAYINEAGLTDKFGFTPSEESTAYIEAFKNSVSWRSPGGYVEDEEVLRLYGEMLPGTGGAAVRLFAEAIPWIPLTLVGMAGVGALRVARVGLLPMQEAFTAAGLGAGRFTTQRLLAGSLRFTRASMRGPVMVDTAANTLIKGALKAGVHVGTAPIRIGQFGKYTLKYAGGSVTGKQVILSSVEVLMGKGIGVWAKNRILAPHLTNRIMLLLRNQHGPEVKEIVQESITAATAKLQAAGYSKAEAAGMMASETANIALDKMATSGGLLVRMEGLARSIPSKLAPISEELATQELAVQGYTLTRADVITRVSTVTGSSKHPIKYIIQRGEEVVTARNLQEVTNFIQTNSTTGLIGGQQAQTMIALISKVGALTPDEQWIFQRLSHEIPGNGVARALVQYNKGLRPSNKAQGVLLNLDEYLERAVMGTDPLDAFTKAEFTEFVDMGSRSPLALATAKARAIVIGAARRGDPVVAEKDAFTAFAGALPDQAAFDPVAVSVAIQSGISKDIILTTPEGVSMLNAVPGTAYDEILQSYMWLTNAIGNLEKWVALERPSTKSYFTKQLKRYRTQLDGFTEVFEKINKGAELTKQDVHKLNVALGPGSSRKPGSLHSLLENSGSLTDRRFFDYEFQDITAANAALNTPRDSFKFLDDGYFGSVAQEEIYFPINNARDLMAESNIILMGKLKNIMFDMNLAGPSNARYRKEVLFAVLKKMDTGIAVEDAATIISNKKMVGVFKEFNVPIENQEAIVIAAAGIRDMTDDLILRANVIRVKLGLPKIGYQKEYMTDIRVGAIAHRLQRFLHAGEGEEALTVERAVSLQSQIWDNLSIPNQKKWDRALEKTGLLKDWEKNKDVFQLMGKYIEGANRDIYLTPFIQNNKLYAETFRMMGLDGNAKFLDLYTAETLLGFESAFDRAITGLAEKRGFSSVGFVRDRMYDLRQAMNTAVLPGNIPWSMFIQTSSTALTVKHVGIKNTLQGYFQWARNTNGCRDLIKQWSTVYRTKAGAVGAKQTRGGGSVIQADILATESLNTFHFSPREQVNYYANIMMRTFEAHLTGGSIQAGYLKGARMGYTGGKRWAYASDVGAKTQSMYNKDDIPAIMRNRILGTSFPFQTFNFEMINAARELLNIRVLSRTGAFRTIAAKSAEGEAVLSQRLLSIAEWVASMAAVNEVVSRTIGRDPYTLASFFPFYNFIVGGALLNDPWGQPLWAKFSRDLTQAVFVDYMKYGNLDALKDIALRYFFPAGVQVNRFIEGMLAMIHHEVTDVKGFPVFDEIDSTDFVNFCTALLCGPWRTKEGQAYVQDKFAEMGTFEKYTGLPYFSDKVWQPDIEEKKATDQLGGMYTNEDGAQELYTTKSWASDMRTAYEHTGPNKFDNFLPWGKEFLTFNNGPVMEEFRDIHGFDENGLPDSAKTTKLRNDEIDANGELDAFMYLFGDRSGLRTPAGLDAVNRWIKKYQIPLEAIEGWDEIDQVQLRYETDDRQWIAGYDKINTTYEGRDTYFARDPEGARRWFTNEARKDGLEEDLQDTYASYYMAGYSSLSGSLYPGYQDKDGKNKYIDEWLLMDDIEFNDSRFLDWLYKNERLTPPFEVWRYPKSPNSDGGSEWRMLQDYETATTPDERLLQRCMSQAKDSLMVRIKGGQMQPCYGTDRCKRVVNEQKKPKPEVGEAEAGISFTEFE